MSTAEKWHTHMGCERLEPWNPIGKTTPTTPEDSGVRVIRLWGWVFEGIVNIIWKFLERTPYQISGWQGWVSWPVNPGVHLANESHTPKHQANRQLQHKSPVAGPLESHLGTSPLPRSPMTIKYTLCDYIWPGPKVAKKWCGTKLDIQAVHICPSVGVLDPESAVRFYGIGRSITIMGVIYYKYRNKILQSHSCGPGEEPVRHRLGSSTKRLLVRSGDRWRDIDVGVGLSTEVD